MSCGLRHRCASPDWRKGAPEIMLTTYTGQRQARLGGGWDGQKHLTMFFKYVMCIEGYAGIYWAVTIQLFFFFCKTSKMEKKKKDCVTLSQISLGLRGDAIRCAQARGFLLYSCPKSTGPRSSRGLGCQPQSAHYQQKEVWRSLSPGNRLLGARDGLFSVIQRGSTFAQAANGRVVLPSPVLQAANRGFGLCETAAAPPLKLPIIS